MDQFQRRLIELNMDSAEELQSYIHKLGVLLELSRQRTLQEGPDSRAEVGVCNRKGGGKKASSVPKKFATLVYKVRE